VTFCKVNIEKKRKSYLTYYTFSALERLKIPENAKGASRQRQILFPSGSRFFGMPTLGVPRIVGG